MTIFDPASFKAPFINFDDIRQKADDFRNNYWKNKNIPVDIFQIIEFELNLEIRPLLGLKRTGDIDSFLLGDFSGIVVDEEEYMDDRYLNRIRYSVAHEIGHIILHRDAYNNFEIDSEDNWIELLQNIPENEYNWIEQQAYEFAGRLLVPLHKLREIFDEFRTEIKQIKNLLPNIEDIKIAERCVDIPSVKIACECQMTHISGERFSLTFVHYSAMFTVSVQKQIVYKEKNYES